VSAFWHKHLWMVGDPSLGENDLGWQEMQVYRQCIRCSEIQEFAVPVWHIRRLLGLPDPELDDLNVRFGSPRR
jgi:hypothetical protein